MTRALLLSLAVLGTLTAPVTADSGFELSDLVSTGKYHFALHEHDGVLGMVLKGKDRAWAWHIGAEADFAETRKACRNYRGPGGERFGMPSRLWVEKFADLAIFSKAVFWVAECNRDGCFAAIVEDGKLQNFELMDPAKERLPILCLN